MTDNKSPSYPWYPRDFANDEPVQLMSLEEEAAYRRLLDHQSLHGSIPAEPSQLARICKNIAVPRMRKLWAAIAPCFVPCPDASDRLYNRKLERVLDDREQYRRQQSESGRRGAEARWSKERPNSDPNGGGTGEPINTPEANTWPASAVASATARTTTTPQSVGPRDRDGEPPVPPGTPEATLINRMARTSDRWAVVDFLDRVPGPDHVPWVRRLVGYLDGLDFPAGVCPTPAQLATACRDFTGDFKSPAHFRAFVLRAIQGPRHADGPAGPRRGSTATGEAQLEAGRRWAASRGGTDG